MPTTHLVVNASECTHRPFVPSHRTVTHRRAPRWWRAEATGLTEAFGKVHTLSAQDLDVTLTGGHGLGVHVSVDAGKHVSDGRAVASVGNVVIHFHHGI